MTNHEFKLGKERKRGIRGVRLQRKVILSMNVESVCQTDLRCSSVKDAHHIAMIYIA